MIRNVLEGHYRPVKEELTVTDLEVTGKIPGHLDGRYVRIGANPLEEPDPATYHYFLGDGMAHGVRIRDGKAEWYRNRWVRTADISRRLGEKPRPGKTHANLDLAVNTNIISQAGRTFAIVEGGIRPYELTDELETVGVCDFDGTLTGGYSAHPYRDPKTGELHAVSYFYGWGNRVQYSVLTTSGRIRKTVDIEVTGSPMMHNFALTENYVVIFDLPVTFDAEMVTRGMPRWMARPVSSMLSRTVGNKPIPEPVLARVTRPSARYDPTKIGLPYSWNPKYPARVGVMPRDGGSDDVRWFEIEPCFLFHHLNAYEEDGGIVIDVIRHPKMFATNSEFSEGDSTLDRWTFNLLSGKVGQDRLNDRHQEFPRFDERLMGQRHRYGYMVSVDTPGSVILYDSLIKHDLDTGQTAVRRFGEGRDASEFTFVPNSADAAEDDGTLMGYVYNPETDRSDLFFLDAQTLDTVATVHLPARVPAGIHGNWMP